MLYKNSCYEILYNEDMVDLYGGFLFYLQVY